MFKHKWIFIAAMLLTAGFAAQAQAQDTIGDWKKYIEGSCGKEVKALCRGVKEGDGRIVACLYSREDKLSPKCGTAVLASMERLGVRLGALANVLRVCEPDAKRLCNCVAAGNGNLLGCLTTAKKAVSATCNTTLDAAMLR